MKFKIISTLTSLLMLSGCDNFVLVKQTGKNDPRLFKIETADTPPTVLTEPSSSQSNSNQTDPKPENSGGVPSPLPIENKPAQIPDNRENGQREDTSGNSASQPTIVKTQPQTSVDLPAQSTQEPKKAAADRTERSEFLSLNEYVNFTLVIENTVQEDVMKSLLKATPAPIIKPTDLKFEASGNFKGLNLKISTADKVIVDLKDLKMNLTDANVQTQSGYEVFGICSGVQCEILFVAAMKLDRNRMIVENYPVLLKKVNGSYVQGVLKSVDEYSKERNADGANRSIKPVPQLVVIQKLQEQIKAHGDKLIAMIHERLNKNAEMVYSDLILFNQKVKSDKLQNRFERNDGQLNLTSRIEFHGPINPIEMKVQVKAEGASQAVTGSGGLSLTVVGLVKDQLFALIFDKSPYASQIKSANKAMQAFLCAVIEEGSETFSKCLPLGASIVLSDPKAVEGNSREKITE